MDKTTEALKLAEEALHNTGNALMCLTTTRNLRPMYQEMRDDAVEGCNKALRAIREALAEHPMDYDQGFVDGVEAQLADPVCEHRIADARNEFIKDGYICIKCGALFRAADHAEPVKQGPVAFMFKVKRTTKAITVLDEFASVDYFPQDGEEIVSKEPLSYAAPVDAKAIRAEALEEAEEIAKTIGGSFSVEFLAAIRGLK